MIRSMVIPDAICFKHGNLVHHKSSSEPITYRYVSVTLLIAVKQIENLWAPTTTIGQRLLIFPN